MCSSLTELFAPQIHKQRLATWPEHYPWIETDGLQYFRNRVTPGAPRRRAGPGGHARPFHAAATEQERALEILRFKLDILWAMNNAMAPALRGERMNPARACPGGFRLAMWRSAQGCHVLLYPEGMVKLNRSAGEILTRCDRHGHASPTIVADLETAVRCKPGPAGRRRALPATWRASSAGLELGVSADAPAAPASARRCGCSRR